MHPTDTREKLETSSNMMYNESSNNNNNNNNNNKTPREKDSGLSPVRKKWRKAPPTPPSPPQDPEVPWGDRKPAAKNPPDCVFKHSPDVISDIEVEIESTCPSKANKDGILLPRNSPGRNRPFFGSPATANAESEGSNGIEIPKPIIKQDRDSRSHRSNSNKMSKRELYWAATVFVLIVMLTVTITAVVMNQQTRIGNEANSSTTGQFNNLDSNGDGMSPEGIPPNGPPSTNGGGGTKPRKISVREEWELVRAAIMGNNVTRFLLEDQSGATAALPEDLFFYNHLVSGMIFSEEERDWIPAPTNDDGFSIEGMDGMSMENSLGEFGNRDSPKKTITPSQKATAWLLFHDELKDPNESVWRWAIASIYFKMGGKHWNFHDPETSKNKWLTSAPLCEWERIYGSSGCEKYKQRGPLLPVELDFGATNMAGQIAIEFALLLEPMIGDFYTTEAAASSSLPATMVRSIMLSDNRLTGTIPGKAFQHLMPSLGKLYLDNNQLTGSVPIELGGLDTLYVQNNALTGDWPREFCESGDKTINGFGLDCDKVECPSSCCGILQCYYSKSF